MAISLSREDCIAFVTLDRADKLKALDPAHLLDLRQALSDAAADPTIRVIVLTGSGTKSFCVGADLTAARTAETSVPEALGLDLQQSGERGLYIRLFDLSGLRIAKPLIAAVNGYCLGGGLELALQCDLIVASETASFGLPEVNVGSLPGGGGVPNLLRAVPRALAMRMLLTGERIDARRAYGAGMVSDLFEPHMLMAGAEAIARRIAENGPVAVQLVKMLAIHAVEMPLAQSFQMTELAWGLVRDSEDRNEGRAAFAEKRKPQYKGR